MRKLGILAGGGRLPGQLADARIRRGGAVFIIAFEGVTCGVALQGREHGWCKLGRVQEVIDRLRAAAVEDVVMAGPVARPAFSSLALDRRGAGLLARAGHRAFGDDGLLSAIAAELEGEGFRVIGVDDVIDGILAPAGRIAGPTPDEAALSDIARGIRVLAGLGAADIGQGVAVQEGLVLAVEAIEGTDRMIARAGSLRRPGPGPVLVKMAKPGQDRRVDLPAIGPETVRTAIDQGFRGAAVQAGNALLVDGDALRRLASSSSFFVYGATPERPG